MRVWVAPYPPAALRLRCPERRRCADVFLDGGKVSRALVRHGMPAIVTTVNLVLLSHTVMRPLIGHALHGDLARAILATATQLELPARAEPLESSLKRELVGHLSSKLAHVDAEQPLISDAMVAKRSRTAESIGETMRDKTNMVRVALANQIKLGRFVNSFVDYERLRAELRRDAGEEDFAIGDKASSRWALAKHMVVLDMALDSLLKDELQEMRDADPGAFGVALATDESPPSQRRFCGFRFQVTVVYIPAWLPEEQWDRSKTPPMVVRSRLLDICHCPSKDGAGVMKVLDKQLDRVGLSRYDVVAMTGDGGAENEGLAQGMHATLEADVPGYVRKRCLGHLAWRVADAVIAEIPSYTEVKKVCEYVGNGVTWTRMQALAVTPVLENGLGLFGERSLEFKRIFGAAPRAIIENRPESDLNFLRFLNGRERTLHMLASRDVSDRSLAAATQDAVEVMASHEGRAQRRVCAEVLHRSLYLHFWVNAHNHICGVKTLDELMDQAKSIIQGVSLDADTMKRLGCSDGMIALKGWERPSTWVELAALLEYEDEALARAALPSVYALHANLVARGTSHLALVVDNVKRTSWMAGALLHEDPVRAQTAATGLLLHLDSIAPCKRTPFERHLADSEELMPDIASFANREVAVCLWQGGGAYRRVFKFLAMRFLLAPDQVIDCERVHARWNWMCDGAKGVRLPHMNATLRLTQHLETNGSEFPSHERLHKHLEQEANGVRVARAEVHANEEIAPGFREQCVHLERFNLRAVDIPLLGGDPDLLDAPAPLRSDFDETSSVYLRNTFVPRFFYLAPALGGGCTWFFVLENKVLAGREARHATDAQTRPLVICFFEKAPGADDELVVRRTDKEFAGMATKVTTPAELALHLGFVPPVDAARSAQETESLVERAWLGIPRTRYTHRHMVEAGDLHSYLLTDPVDAEEAFWNDVPLGEHTKYAIARRLEIEHGWDRVRLWRCSLPQLRTAMTTSVAPWALGAAPGPAAPAVAKGRGRGAPGPAAPAVAKGRGRGALGPAAPAVAKGRGRGGRGRGCI